jgi:hypothetical protein
MQSLLLFAAYNLWPPPSLKKTLKNKKEAPSNLLWLKTPMSCTLTLHPSNATGVPKLRDIFPVCYIRLCLMHDYMVLRCLYDFIYCLSGPLGSVRKDDIYYIIVGYMSIILHYCIISNELILQNGTVLPGGRVLLYLNFAGSIAYLAILVPIIRSVIPRARAALAMLPRERSNSSMMALPSRLAIIFL